MDILALRLEEDSRLYADLATEWEAQELGIVEYLGERCLLLTCRGRMLAVDMAKVKAARCAEEYQGMKVSVNADGEPLVLVKDGMLTTAVILPESAGAVGAIRAMIARMAQSCGLLAADKADDEADGDETDDEEE